MGEVENGLKLSFWHDNWTPLGPLINFIGPSGPRSLRIHKSAYVAEASNGEAWILPSPRSDSALQLHVYLTTIVPPNSSFGPDSYSWIVNDTNCNGFSAARTREATRPRAEVKQLTKSTWFKGAVPKHAFIMWVTYLDRLPTRSRLAAWGIQCPVSCCLCDLPTETRDHLFLFCGYSFEIWKQVFVRLSPSQAIFGTWAELLSWTRRSAPGSPSLLRKLAAQATIFHIWKQRNNVLHNQQSIPSQAVFNGID